MSHFVFATAGAAIGLFIGFFIGMVVVLDANNDALERGYVISKGKLYLIKPAKPVDAP
jgi:hypothetical protein